ncbi:hypothetical protein HID58_020353 [Brassica napus]|uniref:Uncharacterized protein n=1 Tax=Brassica napus TaxID=3708 RepID=A0ABQ7XJA5_BRANA|nr:hypothetical protein HID58_020353 [Brassica napus]
MAELHNKKLLQLLVDSHDNSVVSSTRFTTSFSSIQKQSFKSKTYTFETGMVLVVELALSMEPVAPLAMYAKPEDYLFSTGSYGRTMPRQIKIESRYDIKKMESEMENQWLIRLIKLPPFLSKARELKRSYCNNEQDKKLRHLVVL